MYIKLKVLIRGINFRQPDFKWARESNTSAVQILQYRKLKMQ